MAARPDLANLQGLIVHRYPQAQYAVLLFSIADAERTRAFIRHWIPQVARGDAAPETLTGTLLNLAFTWSGLEALLSGDPELDTGRGARELDFAFTDQVPDHPAVVDQLGFTGVSEPDGWWEGRFKSSAIDLVLYAACEDESARSEILGSIRQWAARSGLLELQLESFADGALSGCRPPGGILHFGYRDGISSPRISWDDDGMSGGVDFREFILGYANDAHPQSPTGGAWLDFVRDGSFACTAWVYQDVAAFQQFLERSANLAPDSIPRGSAQDWIAAKLMGRWPKGSPLIRHPDNEPADPDVDDNFDYSSDRDGSRCPLSAHIRVVHPRDDLLTYPNRVRFPAGPPRLLRRGFSYGPDLAGDLDDGVPRGVVGTFLCARVNEQFYTVLRWMQRASFAESHSTLPQTDRMQDGLLGNRAKPQADTRLVLETSDPARTAELVDFIRYQGVAVAFLPSISSLERLAGEEA